MLHNVVCQLYQNKAEKRKKWKEITFLLNSTKLLWEIVSQYYTTHSENRNE